MELKQAMESRFTARKFKEGRLSFEEVCHLIKPAMNIPTPKESEPQRVLFVPEERREELLALLEQPYEAAAYLILGFDESQNKRRTDVPMDSGVIAASMMAYGIMLRATERNMSALWIGACDLAQIRKEMNLGSFVPVGILALGEVDETPEPKKEIKRESWIQSL